MMFNSHLYSVAVLLSFCIRNISAQNPIFGNNAVFTNNDPQNQQASSNTYYFDRNSDCNKATRNIYDSRATIHGFGSGTAQQGPESCTIKIKSEQQFAGTFLNIEIRSMTINDCETMVAIYDGDGPDRLLLNFDCKRGIQLNQRTVKTSGNTATFVMTRRDTDQFNYNVQINITPIRGGTTGLNPELGGSYFFNKFDQNAIVGMVGGFYLTILIGCFFCIGYKWRSFQGKTKEWETRQLATIKTNSGFDGQSQATGYVNAWSTTHSRPPPSQHSRTHTDAFSRRHGPASEDGDSGVFRYDDDFQKRQLMNEKARMRSGPPTYTSRNESYLEPEDAEDTFTEKVITPRVHSRSNRGRNGRRHQSSRDDSNQSESEVESEEESDSNESTRKRRISSEDSEGTISTSESETDEETDSQTEEESDASSSRRGGGRRTATGGKWKPRKDNKHRRNKKKASSRDSHDSRDSRDTRDSRSTAATSRRGPPPPPNAAGYPAMHPHPAYPPGQFVPVMAAPSHALQPVQMMPGYPPQPYPGVDPRAHPPPPAGGQAPVHGTDPPVYSYLVRRGYTPLDAQSQGSGLSHRSGAGRLEEPETRLSSGVEYMRR